MSGEKGFGPPREDDARRCNLPVKGPKNESGCVHQTASLVGDFPKKMGPPPVGNPRNCQFPLKIEKVVFPGNRGLNSEYPAPGKISPTSFKGC